MDSHKELPQSPGGPPAGSPQSSGGPPAGSRPPAAGPQVEPPGGLPIGPPKVISPISMLQGNSHPEEGEAMSPVPMADLKQSVTPSCERNVPAQQPVYKVKPRFLTLKQMLKEMNQKQ